MICATTATDGLAYYARIGARMYWLPPGSKAAAGPFKAEHSGDPVEWANWVSHGCNIALVAFASQLIIVDVDTSKDPQAWQRWDAICREWGYPAGLAPHCRTQSGGFHVYLRVPDQVDAALLRQPDLVPGVINLRVIGYTVAAGSNFEGRPYTLLTDADPHPAPPALLDLCARKPRPEGQGKAGGYNPEHVAKLLDFLAERGEFENYADWIAAGMALKIEMGDSGFALWERTFAGEQRQDPADKWDSFAYEADGHSVTILSLMKRAHDSGWKGTVARTGLFANAIAQLAAQSGATVPGMPSPPMQASHLIKTSADFTRGFVPPSWLVKGVLQRRYCYALTAATGTGKTAIALRLAVEVARGLPFGGHTTKPGRVLYIAAENFVDVQGRWIGMAEFCGFDPDTVPVHFIAGEIKISEHWESIVHEAQALGDFALIIVDTSAAVFEGEDENSNAQAREHAARMRALTSLPGGPTVLVLCHPTKQAREGEALLPRGGGAFLAEIDGNLIAARKDGSVEVHTAGKFRGPDFAPILFRLETFYPGRLRDEDGQPMPTVVARPLDAAAAEALSAASQDDERQLLDAIHRGAGTLSLADLAKGLGWLNGDGTPAKKKAERIGAALIRRGLAEKTVGGKLKCKSAGEKALNALDAAARKSGQATVPTPSENRAFVPTKT